VAITIVDELGSDQFSEDLRVFLGGRDLGISSAPSPPADHSLALVSSIGGCGTPDSMLTSSAAQPR